MSLARLLCVNDWRSKRRRWKRFWCTPMSSRMALELVSRRPDELGLQFDTRDGIYVFLNLMESRTNGKCYCGPCGPCQHAKLFAFLCESAFLHLSQAVELLGAALLLGFDAGVVNLPPAGGLVSLVANRMWSCVETSQKVVKRRPCKFLDFEFCTICYGSFDLWYYFDLFPAVLVLGRFLSSFVQGF